MAHKPSFVAKGTFVSGIASVTPGLPAGLRNRDLMLLFIHTVNQAVPATPTGWTPTPSSPQSTGTAAAIGGVRLTMYYKWVLGTETAPATGDSGDMQAAIIMAFRGVSQTAPFNVTTGSVDASATTAITYPGVTTTIDDAMIVHGVALDQDIAGTAQAGTPTNANLTSLTEQHDQTVVAGFGGGLAVVTGFKDTAGATGNTTATGAASTTHAYITLALTPVLPLVIPDAQYASDMTTPIYAGGFTTTSGTADATPVYLRTEFSQGNPLDQTATLNVEVDTVATSFANTASHTRTVKQKTSDVRSSRRGASVVYDSINKRYIYFGGFDGTTRYNDVWEQYTDVAGQPWRKVTVTGTPPAGRNMNGATVVTGNLTSGGAVRSYMIIWGGALPADDNAMWSLRIDTPGSEAWQLITQTSAPAVRGYITRSLVATPGPSSDQDYIYLFGGWGAARMNGLYRCTFDVDAPTTVTWTTLFADGAANQPSARSGPIVDYKASTGKLYVFGGYTGTTYLSDFWEYDIAGNTFTNTTPTGTAPAGREMGSGGFDIANNRFWYAGGWDGTTGASTMNDIGYISNVGGSEAYNEVRAMSRAASTAGGDHSYPPHALSGSVINQDRGYLIETGMFTYDSTERYYFAIDLNDGITTDKPAYGLTDGEFFNSRDAASSIYNPDTNEWIITAGFDDMDDDTTIARGTHSSDVWIYNPTLNKWTFSNKGMLSAPPTEGRYNVYDTARDRVILFGGLSGIDQVSNEVWALERDSNGLYKAVRLNPTGTPPTPRWLGAAAYDAVNDRVIIHGGRNVSTLYNDTYSLSFSGSADGAWTTLSPSGTPPTAVWQPGYANVTKLNRMYVFGGGTNTGDTTYSSQLLYFDYTTTSGAWTTPTSSAGTARRGMTLVWDSANDKLLVFGGWNTAVVSALHWWDIGAQGAWVAPTITGDVPDGRRSLGGMFHDGKFYITSGRPATGSMWYSDTWAVAPNYNTPNSTVWVNKTPRIYNTAPVRMINGSSSTGYHWQSWLDETTESSAKVSFPYSIDTAATYYFDGSDAAASDPNNVWTNEANIFDASVDTTATCDTDGSVSTNFAKAEGTNAPSSGGSITQVRARVRGRDSDDAAGVPVLNAAIYTDSLAELLGTATFNTTSALSYSNYVTLSTPSGGWTWAKIQALETKVYRTGGALDQVHASVVEIEVTSSVGNNPETSNDFYLGTPSVSSPTVVSSAVSNLDLTVATANGEVTSDGNGGITERGFVLTLQANADPTTATNLQKIKVTGTTGGFSGQFTGLTPVTLYKYRPYAINSNGTSYGTAINFTSSDYKTFTAYAILANQGGGTTSLILYNRTDSTEVTASEITTTSPGPTLVYKTFAYNATNFATAKDYEFRIKASTGSTALIWSAGLYIKLKNLTKATTYNRVSRFGFQALSAAAAATTQRFLYTAANYSSPVGDWIVTGTEDTNGTNNFQLYNVTTTDSGTTGSGVGSGIDVNSTSKTWGATTGVTLTDNQRYIGIFNYTSGGARYHQGVMAITASGTQGTVETATNVELLDTARSSQLVINYEPRASRTLFSTSHFDGATYYFEIIGTNSHASNAYGVTLVAYNATGTATDVTTQNLTANTGASNARYRTGSITIPTDTVELRVRISATAAAKNVVLGGARVIAVQTNATKTLVHVPMTGSNNEENFDTGWPTVATTQTTYATLANNVDQFPIWKRDDTKFDAFYEAAGVTTYTATHTTSAVKRKATEITHTANAYKETGQAVRYFDGVNDRLVTSLGNMGSITGDITVLAVVRMDTINSAVNRTIVRFGDSAANSFGIGLDGSGVLVIRVAGVDLSVAGITHLPSSGYAIIGFTKGTGTTTPRGHYKPLGGAWTHSNAGATSANPTAAATSNVMGESQDGTRDADMWLGAVGVWDSNLSDGNVETLTSMQSWYNHANVKLLWRPGDTTVKDHVGTADQSSITGTSVANNLQTSQFNLYHYFTRTHTTDALKTIGTTTATMNILTGASADDAFEVVSGGAMDLTTSPMRIGGANHVGWRFPNITLPQGRTIISAKLQFENLASINSNVNGSFDGVTLKGQAIDNAPQFTTTTSDISSRAVTTATGDDDDPNESTWSTFANGVAVTTIVQELLNRAGWVSGNAMVIMAKGGGTTTDYADAYPWDYFTGNQETRLQITYSVAAAREMRRSHTTDAYKSISVPTFTRTHTTDANKKKSGNTLSHTTSANKKKASNTLTHTTSSNKKVSGNTRTHTTNANLKKSGLTLTHTTSANKKVANNTRTHTTSSVIRKLNTVFHTTSANNRVATTVSHTTNANKKVANNTLTHTTSSSIRKPVVIALNDNFNDNSVDVTKWTRIANDTGREQEINNRAEFTTTALTTNYYGFRSVNTYDFTGKMAFAELIDAGNQSLVSLQSVLKLYVDVNNAVTIYVRNGNIYAQKQVANVYSDAASMAYNSTTHRWIRISEHAGSTYWEYSSNGTTWLTLHSEANPVTMTALTAEILNGTYLNTEATATTSIFDNFNTAAGLTDTRTHTTSSVIRKANTLSHTTSSVIRKQNTVSHTTSANKKKATTVSHTTSSNLKKTNTIFHTTSANKKKSGNTVSHTTSSNLKKANNTIFHTTSANKKKAENTLTHTTSSVIRKANTVSHTTSANKKKAGNTVSHTTSSNLKKSGNTLSHTTNSLLRKQNTLVHTTDANKKKATTVSHTTSSNKKKADNTVSHTTSANKKVAGNTRSHTTSSVIRKQNTLSHTTNANKKKSGNTVSHTTSAYKVHPDFTTTVVDNFNDNSINTALWEANFGNGSVTETNNRMQLVINSGASGFDYAQLATKGGRSFNFVGQDFKYQVITYPNNSQKKAYVFVTIGVTRAVIWSYTNGTLSAIYNTGTDNVLFSVAYSSTYSWQRIRESGGTIYFDTAPDGVNWTNRATQVPSGTLFLDAVYGGFEIDPVGTTTSVGDFFFDNVNIGGQFTRTHTTDANKKKATTVSHTTSANKKKSDNTVSHTTSANKRVTGNVVSHTTNSLLRKANTVSHTTNANKKRATTVSHTTSANKRLATIISHTTSANKKKSGNTVSHTTDALKKVRFTVSHTTNAYKRTPISTTIYPSMDGSVKRTGVDETFSTIRNGSGNATDLTSTSDATQLAATSTSNQYGTLTRGMFTFDTSSIPDEAIINSVTLSLYGQSKANFLGTAPDLHVAGATPASPTTLANSDYANVQRTSFGNIAYASFSTTAYNDIVLNASGIAAINLTGYTSFSTQLAWDLNNSFTGSWSNASPQVYSYYMSEDSGTTRDPKLVISYSLPPLVRHTTDANKSLTATVGWNDPSASSVSADGWDGWGTPGNVYTSNDARATATLGINASWSNFLIATGFGFSIPAGSTINGIEMQFERNGGANSVDRSIRVVKGGSYVGTDKSAGAAWPTTDGYSSVYGGPSDLWGTTWTVADINASNFGIAIQAGHAGGFTAVAIDHIRMRVTYTPGLVANQYTRTHTTDALKRKANTLTHTTSSVVRKANTVSHTTNTLLRKQGVVSHTTNSLKRTLNVLTHTTSSFIRKANTVAHTTNSNKRRATTVSHTTSANLKKTNTVFHTTDANKKKAGNTVAHTTSAVIRKANTLSHTTNAFKRTLNAISHTTNSLLRKQNTLSHTTSANRRKATTVVHTTDSNKRKVTTVGHTTDANKKKAANVVSHTTSSVIRKQNVLSHTTSAFKRTANTLTHTTNAFLRKSNNLAHTTNALLRRQVTVSHTTSSNLKKSGLLVTHTTSANKRKANNVVSHTTSSFIRTGNTLTHTTNALLRKLLTLSHTTNSFLRTRNALAHTTNSFLRKANTLSHTTSANKRVANNTVSHTTSANKRTSGVVVSHTTNSLLRRQLSLTHTTNAFKRTLNVLSHTTSTVIRKANTLTHTTNANKRRATTVSHSTDANKKKANNLLTHTTSSVLRKLNTLSHTTNSFLRRQLTLSHTTNAFKRTHNTLVHTTNSFLRKQNTVAHTTNANKRKSTVVSHTTDTLKRSLNVLSHTTDAFKRTLNALTHTTDSFLRRRVELSHTTDAFRRAGNALTHTTDANKKKANNTVSHSTDANKKRSGNLVSHTTNALLRSQLALAHTTNALKRTLNVLSHTTSTVIRKANTLSHTTDANRRKATTVSHTTNSNLRRAYTVSHTTSSNKRVAGNTVSHTTSANKRTTNNIVSHTTNALKRTITAVAHTTNSLLRKANTVVHTTSSVLRKTNVVSHATDANLRRAYTVAHTTNANKRKADNTVSHTTSSVVRKSNLLSHTTDALKKTRNDLSHTTNALLRRAVALTHTTNSFLRKANLVSHTTGSVLRKANTLSHTTNALKRTLNTVSHTTDALIKIRVELTHTTDSFLRRRVGLTHTTDSNKKKVNNVVFHDTSSYLRGADELLHSTDANKRKVMTISHTTDASKKFILEVAHTTNTLLRRGLAVSHTTSANKRLATVLSHTTNALLRTASAISHTTDSNLRRVYSVSHTTNALLRRALALAHTTSANKRLATIVSHTTNALKRTANAVSHTTSANRRKITTVSHTTNAFLRTRAIVSHTTNSFLRKAVGVFHTTDANLKKSQTISHTTGSFLRAGNEAFHTTNANKKKAFVVSHSTSANKRKPVETSHTTNALLRKAIQIAHTTNALLRKVYSVVHTTSSNKRKANNVVSHTTSSNLRKGSVVSHTTNTVLRTRQITPHTTDAFLRKARTVSHSTSANKRRAQIANHTTDASLFLPNYAQHTTDAYLFAQRGNKKVLVNGVWVYGTVKVLEGEIWVVKPVYIFDGSTWILSSQ